MQLPWITSWACLAGCLWISVAQAADPVKYQLDGAPRKSDVTSVKVHLDVGGELKILEQGKPKSLKMSVVGDLHYHERILEASTASKRSIRHYEGVDATIKIEESGMKPTLPKDRRLIACDATKDNAELYSPSGPLTRDELDLIDTPANSVLLSTLLPEKPVAIGETWQTSGKAWAPLLNLDAVGVCDVTGILTSVEGNVATVEAHGQVAGAICGVSTDIEIKSRLILDLQRKRITHCIFAIKENRSIGHVGPGLDVVARVQVSFEWLKESPALTPAALAGVPTEPNPAVLALKCELPGVCQFVHGRDWYAMNADSQGIVLRMIQNGDLKAQCNMFALPSVKPGQRYSPERFQQSIREGLGKNFAEISEAGESDSDQGLFVQHAVIVGTASELPMQWTYFLLTDDQGRQCVFTFTVEVPLVADIGKQDWNIIDSVRFAPADSDTAAKPSEEQTK